VGCWGSNNIPCDNEGGPDRSRECPICGKELITFDNFELTELDRDRDLVDAKCLMDNNKRLDIHFES